MGILVGTQSDIVALLNELIELDYDAIVAYEAAIDRLDSQSDIAALESFAEDHRRHTEDLAALVTGYGERAATKPDLKRILTKGKVIVGGWFSHRAVLVAMKDNEVDTNRAYERALRRYDIPAQVRLVLDRNLQDERRHRAWMQQRIDRGMAPAIEHRP